MSRCPPSICRTAAIAACIACVVSGCATAPASEDRNARDSGSAAGARDASPAPQTSTTAVTPKPASPAKPRLDRSGSKQVGKASFYADKFAGRKMADGTRMNPQDDNAASKTLPLGTVARVTNLETGRSAVVTIQDRGPYIKGRVVDLSPATAREIGISKADGVARVEITPLSIPPADNDPSAVEAKR